MEDSENTEISSLYDDILDEPVEEKKTPHEEKISRVVTNRLNKIHKIAPEIRENIENKVTALLDVLPDNSQYKNIDVNSLNDDALLHVYTEVVDSMHVTTLSTESKRMMAEGAYNLLGIATNVVESASTNPKVMKVLGGNDLTGLWEEIDNDENKKEAMKEVLEEVVDQPIPALDYKNKNIPPLQRLALLFASAAGMHVLGKIGKKKIADINSSSTSSSTAATQLEESKDQ